MTREFSPILTTYDQCFDHPPDQFNEHEIDAECQIEAFQSPPSISYASSWTIEPSLDENYSYTFPETPIALDSWNEDSYAQPWPIQDVFPTESISQQLIPAQCRREKSVDQSEASDYRCSLCGQSFRNRLQLEQHARQSKHRCFQCPHPRCTSSYYRRDLFTRHKKVHQNAVHLCVICRRNNHSMVFRRKDHLSQHIRNRHPAADLVQDPGTELQRTDSCSTFGSLDIDISGGGDHCDPRSITSSYSDYGQDWKLTPSVETSKTKGQGIQEIVQAIQQSSSECGHDKVPHTLVERWGLDRNSKTFQVAEKLIRLALQSPEVLEQCVQSN